MMSEREQILDRIASAYPSVPIEELEAILNNVPHAGLLWVLDIARRTLGMLGDQIFTDLKFYEDLEAYAELMKLRQESDELLGDNDNLQAELGSARNFPSSNRSDDARSVEIRAADVLTRTSRWTDRVYRSVKRAGRQAVELARLGQRVILTTAEGANAWARDIAASNHARMSMRVLTGILYAGALISLPINPGVSAFMGAAASVTDWISGRLDALDEEEPGPASARTSSQLGAHSISDEIIKLSMLLDLRSITDEEFKRAKQLILGVPGLP